MQQTALQGIKVIDLTRVLAGPSCTQILADFGADVIKIERPHIGDETRQWTPPCFDDGTSAYFSTANRNKKSFSLDITQPEAQHILHRLIQDADIVVENFKVDGLKKYQLDYDCLKKLNPRLIYASLTGFGQTGIDAHKAGYDYIIQGLSGLMSITGEPHREPQKVGVAIVDLFAGMQLVTGILTALFARERTGIGQYVDVALLDSAIALTANIGMNYLATGNTPQRLGNAHANIVPYQVFACQDGHFILACGNDEQFKRICQITQQDWANDERFSTNPQRVAHREQLIPLMQDVFMQQTRAYWLTHLEQVHVPCGSIHSIAEAFQQTQVQQRQMIVDFAQSPIKTIGNPIKLSHTPVQYQTPPPQLGEHSQQILHELGYSNEQIQRWQQMKMI